MKFLIVDDSATMRRVIISSLQRLGHTEYTEAADGQEALMRFDESINCVITDWNMPQMNGVTFTRELRKLEHGVNVPILMVTTRSVRDDIIEAAKAGVNNFVVKPFTPQILREKLNNILGAAFQTA